MSNERTENLRALAQMMRADPECDAAAKMVDEAADEMDRLTDALESLIDEQNGPPLYRHAKMWHSAMAEACLLVGRESQAIEHEKKAR